MSLYESSLVKYNSTTNIFFSKEYSLFFLERSKASSPYFLYLDTQTLILASDLIPYFFANGMYPIPPFRYSNTTFFFYSNVYFDIKIPTSKKLDFWSNFLGSVQMGWFSF